MKQLSIKDVMSKPIGIAKSASISEALDKMLSEGADPLIVTHNGNVIGVLSRKSIAETLGSKKNSKISPNSLHVATTVEDDFTSAYPDQNIDILIPLLQHYKLVVILDHEHRLIGQVTQSDLLIVLRPNCAIEEVIETGYTIQADERVVHLRRRMLDDNITKFIVNENSVVVGIVTETDIAKAMRSFRKVVDDRYQDHRIRNLIVKDIMSSPVITIDQSESISAVIDLMLKKNISCVPVTLNNTITGIITKESLIRSL